MSTLEQELESLKKLAKENGNVITEEDLGEKLVDFGLTFEELNNIKVIEFQGLLVNYCKENEIDTLVRGVRSEADVNYELQMAHMNKELDSDIETIFLPTNKQYSFVSSSLIKEVLNFGADVKNLVPSEVLKALENKTI